MTLSVFLNAESCVEGGVEVCVCMAGGCLGAVMCGPIVACFGSLSYSVEMTPGWDRSTLPRIKEAHSDKICVCLC